MVPQRTDPSRQLDRQSDLDYWGNLRYFLSNYLCTSGIGKETAKQLAMFGATIIITARNHEKGQKCVAELILETNNPNIEYQYLDFCDLESINVAAEKLRQRLKRLDVLINCAGTGWVTAHNLTKYCHEVMYPH
jgi:short-subunit dehydrogenase